MSGKRPFPATWGATSFSLKQGRADNETASKEYQAPRIIESRVGSGPRADDAPTPKPCTDFTTWTEEAVKQFLEQRGEDYDDCIDFYALAQRAFECEQQQSQLAAPAPDEEDDPLEAFMADIGQTIEKEKQQPKDAPGATGAERSEQRTQGCDDDDAMAEYMEAHEQAAQQSSRPGRAAPDYAGYGSDEEVYAVAEALDAQADDDDLPTSKQGVEPLPPMQHELVTYAPFKKDLYDENPEVFAMDEAEVREKRAELQIQVSGSDPPRPVLTFDQCGFDSKLSEAIRKAGYKEPTAIQAQALPAALSGRDVLGIAKTGSGKTAAFLLPMVVHVSAQPRVREGEGPIAVILAPTRELAEQIHQQSRLFLASVLVMAHYSVTDWWCARKCQGGLCCHGPRASVTRFSKLHDLRSCAAFGGLAKYQQMKELRSGAEVAIATPGRMIDLVKSRACDFMRTTYLVIDEADRCFDLGFEPQVFSIVRHIRPDRQTLLFSATMPRRVQHLAAEALTDPVRVTIGTPGGANVDIRQAVLLMATPEQKLQWVGAKVQSFIDDGDVLVFCNQKKAVDELVVFLKGFGVKAEGMHGDLDQHTRMAILNNFKAGKLHVLVATDVAARGLDIRSIKTVINFDAAKELDMHVHRIGRTGRAGDKDGTAYTLLMPRESRMAAGLVRMLQEAGQDVPKNLHNVAMKDHSFKGSGGGGRGRGKPRAVGGRGLGFGPSGHQRHGSSHDDDSSHAATTPRTSFHPASTHPPSAAGASHEGAAQPPTQSRAPVFAPPSSYAPAGQRGLGATAASAPPRGFVSSSKFVGGDDNARATIVMPVGAEVAAARNERPAEWMQRRLQQRPGGGAGARWGAAPTFVAPAPTPAPASSVNDAVARAIETARQVAERARQESSRGHAGASESGAFNRWGDASAREQLPPPPARGSGSYNAAPPPSFGAEAFGGGAQKPPLSAEEARAVAQAAAARITGGSAGGAGAALPGGTDGRVPLSAEAARAIAQAAASRIVAQAGSATASGQTQDGQQWAWGKS